MSLGAAQIRANNSSILRTSAPSDLTRGFRQEVLEELPCELAVSGVG